MWRLCVDSVGTRMCSMSMFKYVAGHRMALGNCPSADCSQIYRKPRPSKPIPAQVALKRPKGDNRRKIQEYERKLKKLEDEAEAKAEEEFKRLKVRAAEEDKAGVEFSAGGLFHCDMCDQQYCSTCLTAEGLPSKWHEGVTCEEYHARLAMSKSNRAAQEAFLKWRQSQGAKLKPCPACSILCEKVSGCNRITCACGKSFCWKCGTFSADSAAKVYAHLNKEHGGYH